MIAAKLFAGGWADAASERLTREVEVGYRVRVHRKSHSEFVLIAFMSVVGFAILISMLVYISAGGN